VFSIRMNPHPLKGLVLLVLISLAMCLTGCGKKYEEGLQEGYARGAADAEARVRGELEPQIASLKQQYSSSVSSLQISSTSSCGGSGINLNGKYYSGGKTGCVRVYSDGRVERY
jgi:hypothetical protein